jgi:hypothetical protein
VIDLLQQGIITAPEGPHFDLSDVKEAVKKSQEPAGKRGGKIMLVG